MDVQSLALDLYSNVQAMWQAPSYHLIFEACLIVCIVRLIFKKRYIKGSEKIVKLTPAEEEQLLQDWKPEPLVKDLSENDLTLLRRFNSMCINGKLGKTLKIDGKECLNFGTYNFLGMLGRADIEAETVAALRQYGVGACGPRGFYGTVDVHLNLESAIAKFLHCEEAIIYSYGFAAIASAIPAYSKRGDVIFCDDGVNFAIQKGVQASRSQVYYFKHNDLEDLQRYLKIQEEADARNTKKAKVTRRFLITEGLFVNYGDICPLPSLIDLKNKYKLRLFLDESMSIGVLGATGRGILEHFNIDVEEVDLICASIENAFAAHGGFCCGKSYVVDHQRLSGLGYCFSASQPPLVAASAIKSLEILSDNPEMTEQLRSLSIETHRRLMEIPQFDLQGVDYSPIKHLRLASRSSRQEDVEKLEAVVDEARNRGIAMTVARYLESEERNCPLPSIRVTVSVEMSLQDLDKLISTLRELCSAML